MQNSIKLSNKRPKNLNFLPTGPGIYKFLDSKRGVVYIGKAKNLRKRIKSYFSESKAQSKKVERLTSESLYLEITITTSELEALLLEQHLIKEIKPKYNVQFKDDKGYPWIRISTSKKYPAANSFLGKKDSKDLFFGPFPSSYSVKNTLRVVQKIFKIRDCSDSFFKNRSRPCLQYEIGRCSAPCTKEITISDYLKDVEAASNLLQGKGNHLLQQMYIEMDRYSSQKSYEKAADYRNKISSLREVQRDQSIAGYSRDRDAVSVLFSEEKLRIGVTSVRGGWIVSHKNYIQENSALEDSLLNYFLSSYYTRGRECPEIILISEDLQDKNTIRKALSKFHNKKISISNKLRGRDIGLMEISKSNTALSLRFNKSNKKDKSYLFTALRQELKLQKKIKLIESYDISHFSGKNAIAGRVVFDKKGKIRNLYRTYKISREQSGNDIGSMKEVIERRFKSKRKSDQTYPEIVLLDGGKNHLNAIRKLLDDLKVTGVYLVSISKGIRRKPEMDTIHTEKGTKIRLKDNSPLRLLLQEIRDEAHRFSITKQQKDLVKKVSKSSLDIINKIGKKRKRSLIRYFGSVEQISKATISDLMKVKGIGAKTAYLIFTNLH